MTVSAAARHRDQVERVATQVRALAARGERAHVDKGGVHHVVPVPGDGRFRGARVDASALTAILEVDPIAGRCTAGAAATFAQVLDATLPYRLMPAVVPELTGITVGGAVAGCSIESASWRVGGFHDTCLAYEYVSGDGRIATCSLAQDRDVFDMLHGSYGTLGVLTAVTFALVPAAPYVHVTYERYRSAADLLGAIRRYVAGDDAVFLDGIAHARDRWILCVGRQVASAPTTFEPLRDGPYYRATTRVREHHLTLRDYLFRYDPDAHWLSCAVPPLEWRPVRRTLGRAVLGSTNLIRASRRLERVFALRRRPDVVVDVFLPSRRLLEFVDWYQRELDFWPLWVVPYTMPAPYPWIADDLASRLGDDLFIDCAVYGLRNDRRDVDLSQLLEERVHELDGFKTLISRNHYSEAAFWAVYSRPRYEAAKARLDPHGVFPTTYEKLGQVS